MPHRFLFFLLVGVAPLAACDTTTGGSPAVAPVAADRSATFSIEGMTCASCSVTVKAALGRVPGVADVQVDTDAGKAVVRFDSAQVSADRIAAAITESGYPSTVQSAAGPADGPG